MEDLAFLITEPDKPPREIAVASGVSFGRHPQNTCVLEDGAVGAYHAQVVTISGDLVLEDLGSRNGTRVRGREALAKGECVPIRPGLEVRLGRTDVRVVGRGAPAPAAADEPPTAQDEEPPTEHDPAPGPPAPPALGADEPPTEQGDSAPPPPPPRRDEPRPAPPSKPAPPPPKAAPPPSKPAPPPPRARAPEPPPEPPLEDGGDGRTIGEDEPEMEDAATAAYFAAAQPRLVFSSETVWVTSERFVVGRGEECQHRIENDRISDRHAQVSFNIRRFFVRDLGSRNNTFVNEEMVPTGSTKELKPNVRLRFGPIEALWVTKFDSRGAAIPASAYEDAAQSLVRRGKITARQKAGAEAEARKDARRPRHVGEMLVLAGQISVQDWVGSMRRDDDGGGPEPTKPTRLTLFQVLLLVVLLAIVAILAKLAGLY